MKLSCYRQRPAPDTYLTRDLKPQCLESPSQGGAGQSNRANSPSLTRRGCYLLYPSLAYTEGVGELIAVVETEEFLADVKGVLSEDEGPGQRTEGHPNGMEGEAAKMNESRGKQPARKSTFGDKLLRSAQQARDWVNGKPVRVRVTYVPVPRLDVRKLRAKMGLSQTQFAAKFGFSLDSVQNWEQGHRQPEGPARVLLAVIAKNPKAVEEALAS